MADQSDRPEPDHAEDPRRGEDSESGYPETQPDDVAGEATKGGGGPRRDTGSTDAPSTSSRDEGDAGEATGNPRAAG
jgi:hypothetical protein